MQLGRKIYHDKATGNIIVDTGERQGPVIATTIEQDIAAYTDLSERNRDTFDVIELAFGQFAQDFAECNGYHVNLETKTLEFSYPDPNEPNVEQPYQAPLSEQVEELRLAQQETNETLLAFMESSLLS
ncbi:MAG TPA: hypothetical protein VNU45_18630 [Rummeliibacillus sp.]|nr:hypothetical protein [Rummeliibacillus sp.]